MMALAGVAPVMGTLLTVAPAEAAPEKLWDNVVVDRAGLEKALLDPKGLETALRKQVDKPGDQAGPGRPEAPDMDRKIPEKPLPSPDDSVEPSFPLTVPQGAFGYLATRSATLWLHQQRPGDKIRGFPVPAQYRMANDVLADQIDRELKAAAKTAGACVQIIFNPHSTPGNLFDYGVWSVEEQYCP
ncbi:MAG: hypothetical protein QM809_15965 [Gordonia sp. (in: high G+C Gram-positive bacteria)]|uniref:hypothetical protein n=1 Tax=Gordonia sp. (in: high G+C Gram-positive bacteria) TaxID=84139 RepID=UPI0039E3EEA8